MVEAKGVPQLQEKTSTIKTKGEDIPVTDSAKSKGADTTDRPSDSGSNSPQSQR